MNRSTFYKALQRVDACTGLLSSLIELSQIVSALQHPCLRLDLLQYILGLDTRYSAQVLRKTVDFALKSLVEPEDDELEKSSRVLRVAGQLQSA